MRHTLTLLRVDRPTPPPPAGDGTPPAAVPVQPPRDFAGRLGIGALRGTLRRASDAAKANHVGDTADHLAAAVRWLRAVEKAAAAAGRDRIRGLWLIGRWLEHHAPRSPGKKGGLYAAAIKAAGIKEDEADRLRAIGRIPPNVLDRMLTDDGKRTKQRFIEAGSGYGKDGKPKKKDGRGVRDHDFTFTEIVEKYLVAKMKGVRAAIDALRNPRVLGTALWIDSRVHGDTIDSSTVLAAYPRLRPIIVLAAAIESLYEYARDDASRGGKR